MTPSLRRIPALVASLLLAALMGVALPTGPALAQNLFAPVIFVNDQAITRYEIQQRARMLTLFRAPGDPQQLAREQLIEERIKLMPPPGRGSPSTTTPCAPAWRNSRRVPTWMPSN